MWNLTKNIIRSLKKNILSLIGLIFLIFLSTGIFTVLNGSTTAINNEYSKISNEGNLHDFTVSELYAVGVASYSNTIEDVQINSERTEKSPLYDYDYLVKDVYNSKTTILPYITYSTTSETTYFTFHYLLDVNGLDDNSALKTFLIDCYYTHHEKFNHYIDYLMPTITVPAKDASSSSELITYINDVQQPYGINHPNQTINVDPSTINQYITKAINNKDINTLLNTISSELETLVSNENTPMDNYLSDELSNEVSWKNIKSLNIDNSPDAIYYKAVTSEPTDTIDKMVLIDDALKGDGVQWNTAGSAEATYGILDSSEILNGTSIGDVLRYLPTQIEDEFDITYLQKVWLMSKANLPSDSSFPISAEIKSLTNDYSAGYPTTDEQKQTWWTNNKTTLIQLLANENSYSEQASVKEYKVVLNYKSSLGNPYQIYIDNWSGLFCVVSPEYMQQHNLRTMSPSMYENEQSYIDYVKQNPGVTDQRSKFLGWLNSLTWPQIESWFNSVTSNEEYSNQIITPGGGTPFIIVGTGITPDYIYPIVSIDRATPNPEKECIFFTSNIGYDRLYDSFRGNTCEDYIVGKFASGVNHQQILDEINDYAAQTMIYPTGTKAAYFASDTANTLNASAYRVAFIPSFLNNINLVANSLTIFVLVLSLVICAIVIHRYIVSNQSVIGIIRANGVSKWAIACSLLPFALIPCVIGGAIGNIVGTLLEIPVLGLFKSYWMLPTNVLGFSIWGFVVPILIFSVIFAIIVFATTFWVLRKNVVDLMKANSQDNPNAISKAVKASATKFGVMTRYRLSVAFSSIWKLLVLVVCTALTLSSIIFTTSIDGKFQDSMNATNAIHNYSYAIQLTTPTTSGGQYKPICYDVDENGNFLGIGADGFIQAGNDNRDTSYFQSLYFGQKNEVSILSYKFTLPGNTYSDLPSIGYEETEVPLNQALQHDYYFSTYLLNWLNNIFGSSINTYMQSIYDAFKINDQTYSDLFVPNMGDLVGETYDMFYLKDRDLTKTATDFPVGVTSLGISTNPWSIGATLMPDNIKNTCESHSKDFQDFIGNAIYYQEGSSDIKYKSLYESYLSSGLLDTFKTYINQPSADNPLYSFNTDQMMNSFLSVALKPEAIKMLTIAYNNPTAAKIEYVNYYDKVPLANEDETYTWIDATNIANNDNVTIYGIKSTPDYETKYINLVNKNGTNLIDLIHYTYDDYLSQSATNNFVFPMVVNEYTAEKYHLNVGNELSFYINNRADRYEHQMKIDNNITDSEYDNKATFKVVGIVNSYEGQEYYIDQDVANYLLRLKSHLFDGNKELQQKYSPNSYYGYDDVTLGLDGIVGFTVEDGVETQAYLINLNNYVDLVPYGFNGVYTNKGADAALLANSLTLYSPTGSYFSNDRLDSTDVLNTLSYGANVKMMADMILDPSLHNQISLFANIDQAYNNWQEVLASGQDAQEAHKALTSYAAELINFVKQYFGVQVYESDVTGAIDKNASAKMYSNMSTTIESITTATIVVIIFMSAIIVYLITTMIIDDSKRLAAILKALGYTDKENAATYLSIYIPVILFGLAIAAAASVALISIYNTIIFNGMQIWLNAQIRWYDYLIGFSVVGIIFALSAIKGVISLKKNKVANAIKG